MILFPEPYDPDLLRKVVSEMLPELRKKKR